ncbi:MAG: hypothetical protein WD176_05020 [Pirellulales bacterium]
MLHHLLRAAAATSLVITGCATLDPPYLGYPGSVAYQRAVANRWDPYPDDEAGPSVSEVRPREFKDAPPESSRARWVRPPR